MYKGDKECCTWNLCVCVCMWFLLALTENSGCISTSFLTTCAIYCKAVFLLCSLPPTTHERVKGGNPHTKGKADLLYFLGYAWIMFLSCTTGIWSREEENDGTITFSCWLILMAPTVTVSPASAFSEMSQWWNMEKTVPWKCSGRNKGRKRS